MLSRITQCDAEYNSAIAMDGKRDNIAMKTIAILGIVFLPGTFVASLFSIGMFDRNAANSGGTASPTVLPSKWIYWAITVPLTVVTILAWVLWSRRENYKRNKALKIYRSMSSIESESAAATKVSTLVFTGKMA